MNTSSRTPRIAIDEFSIHTDEGSTYYRNTDEVPRPEHAAAVLVRLDVDGQSNIVYLDPEWATDITVLTRTIDTLALVRDRLETMCPPDSRQLGRCMARGDWGTCKATDGHIEAHEFPTEAEWEKGRPNLRTA